MSFKILIVKDEDLYADKLEMLVDKLGYEHLTIVDNSKDALSWLEKVDSIDLQDSVIIIGEKQVPLSKRNRAVVLEKLN